MVENLDDSSFEQGCGRARWGPSFFSFGFPHNNGTKLEHSALPGVHCFSKEPENEVHNLNTGGQILLKPNEIGFFGILVPIPKIPIPGIFQKITGIVKPVGNRGSGSYRRSSDGFFHLIRPIL